MKNVTIVIPVYKDWESLSVCLNSLKKYVKTRHKVLIVNDRGPNWEEMGHCIRQSIKGCHNFFYDVNIENMGFVKTCNRAVYELDQTDNDILLLNSDTKVTEGFLEEMLQVLYAQEKHGVVCPRSNHAMLLSMPVSHNTKKPLKDEVCYAVFEQMRDILPRYTVIPTGVGFSFLIKRSLIRKFGLFDEVYGRGYNEENDFCMRINQYGYSVIMANRAFVYHFEGRSFGTARKKLEMENRRILLSRYPFYDAMISRYFNHSMAPAEYFADLIAEQVYEKKRLLFSLYEMPASFNGTAQYGLSIVKYFYRLFSKRYDIHILINEMADELFGVSKSYPKVWYPHNIKGTFHLAFSPSQVFHIEHLFVLNRVSLKYVFCMQDIISLRSNYLLMEDYERYDVFRKSIQYCAAMTSISHFSLKDTMGYYAEEFADRDIRTKVIHHGLPKSRKKPEKAKLPFDDYFIVFGNFYKHKYLKETIPYIKKLKEKFIVLGSEKTGKIAANIYGYQAGKLSDRFVSQLVQCAKAILFPSVYEGFGLPILDGIHYDKKVIVCDNELNRELKGEFDNFSENIYLYDSPEELKSVIKKVSREPGTVYKGGKKTVRTWYDAARELEEFLHGVMEEKTDIQVLNARWKDMRYLENVHRMYVEGKQTNKMGLVLRFKLYLYDHHPVIFLFLHHGKRMINFKFRNR
ncbi:MAG: glycosyltransferase [Eubacterium sp.]|nr:glycosyltransferase [Eubacterium sp.]